MNRDRLDATQRARVNEALTSFGRAVSAMVEHQRRAAEAISAFARISHDAMNDAYSRKVLKAMARDTKDS